MSSIFFYLSTKRQQTVLGNANAAATAAGMTRKELNFIPILDSEVTRPSKTTALKCNDKVPVIDQRTRRMLTTGVTYNASAGSLEEDVYQVDVAFLSYVENCETNAHVRLDSITFASAAELIAHEDKKRKQKAEMGKNAYKHFKWYIRALKDELASLGPNKKFKIVHWLISSKNVRAFMIKSEFFPAISIIIAPKKEHWYAAYSTEERRSKYGTRTRSTGSVSVNDHVPTYRQCRKDFCANNCVICMSAPDYKCLCNNLRKGPNVSTVEEEEDLGDLV